MHSMYSVTHSSDRVLIWIDDLENLALSNLFATVRIILKERLKFKQREGNNGSVHIMDASGYCGHFLWQTVSKCWHCENERFTNVMFAATANIVNM